MAVQLEHKTALPLAPSPSVSEDDEPGTFTALVAVTGVRDNVNDIIVPGAVKGTLVERIPKGVHSHDDKEWTARTLVAEEWMPADPRLPKTTRDGKPWPKEAGAVFIKGQFNLGTDEGRRAYENVKFFREQCEWSIGYAVVPGRSKRDSKGVRHIFELALFEYSTVLVAANPLAMTLSVKSQFGGEASVDVNVPDGVTPQDIAEAVAQVLERKDGGADRNRGNAEQLRHWYVRGEGAARIAWGTDGDFDRCVAIASEHMDPEKAKGYCNLRHHEATGTYPGSGHGHKSAELETDNAEPRFTSVADPVTEVKADSSAQDTDEADSSTQDAAAADDADDDSTDTTDQFANSVMVALRLPADVAEQLAVPDGLDAADLHVTLAYLGDNLDPDTVSLAQAAVEQAAALTPPLEGTIGGIGAFPPGDDGTPMFATVDVPGLEVLRRYVVDALDAAGVPYAKSHGYTPHVTLAYAKDGEPLLAPIAPTPVSFGELVVAVGGDDTAIPLTGTSSGGEAEVKDVRLDMLRASGVPVPLSYEEIRDRIRDGIARWLGPDDEGRRPWVSILATFPGSAIVTVESPAVGEPEETYTVPYTLDVDGTVHLGEPQPVAVSVTVPPGGSIYEPAADLMADMAYGLKALLGFDGTETKAGRVLSDANAKRLRAAVASLLSVLKAAGVDLADPEPADQPGQAEELPQEAPVKPDSTAPSAQPTSYKELTVEEYLAGMEMIAAALAVTA